jgi:hypothetical protein
MSLEDDDVDMSELLRLRTRAQRHAGSLPLAFVGLALLALAALGYAQMPWDFWFLVGVPVVAFVLLYLAMRLQRLLTGLGSGRDGYGVVAIVVPMIAVFVPFVTPLLGPVFLLGVGLIVIGWRGRERTQWTAGAALVVLGPLVALGTIDNHARFLGSAPSSVVLAFAAGACLLVAARRLVGERHALVAELIS